MTFLRQLIKSLLFCVLLFGGFLFLFSLQHHNDVRNQSESGRAAIIAAAPSRAVPRISNAELQTLIADVYHVEQSRFIQPDLLWVTLPAGVTDVQATCQAIANVWALRSGLAYVRVESWRGTTRLGQGTVYNQQFVTP